MRRLSELHPRELEQLLALTTDPRWTCIQEEFQAQYDANDTLVGAHTTEEMWRRSGRLEVLHYILSLEQTVRDMIETA